MREACSPCWTICGVGMVYPGSGFHSRVIVAPLLRLPFPAVDVGERHLARAGIEVLDARVPVPVERTGPLHAAGEQYHVFPARNRLAVPVHELEFDPGLLLELFLRRRRRRLLRRRLREPDAAPDRKLPRNRHEPAVEQRRPDAAPDPVIRGGHGTCSDRVNGSQQFHEPRGRQGRVSDTGRKPLIEMERGHAAGERRHFFVGARVGTVHDHHVPAGFANPPLLPHDPYMPARSRSARKGGNPESMIRRWAISTGYSTRCSISSRVWSSKETQAARQSLSRGCPTLPPLTRQWLPGHGIGTPGGKSIST